MADANKRLTMKLLELMHETGYPIVQHNGQRKTGPPQDWTGPPPPRGCEIFIGKLPRDVFEDELLPLFSSVGRVYEMRLMMDFSGSNRGYAFVTYANQALAAAAVKRLDCYEIKPRRRIGVVKSVDNCRLFIGNLPRTKTKEELVQELSKRVTGVVDVILNKNSYDRNLNRGFAFIEFQSHKAAAMARRELVPGFVKLWDTEVMVDWAEPEPIIDDEDMKRVKVLYLRNLLLSTTPDTITRIFEETCNSKVERVKKMYDYAFIHFFERKHAELAMTKLQNTDIDGSNIEICWARPVDRDLYRIQKLGRGNAKFNNGSDLRQTLLLYKQHVGKREYANGSPNAEFVGPLYAGESSCYSPVDMKPVYSCSTPQSNYSLAPVKLDVLCKKYLWAPPVYGYQKYVDPFGAELWVCSIDLPQVGMPLFAVPQHIGPLFSRTSCSMVQANCEASERALETIQMLRDSLAMQSAPAPAPVPVYSQMPPPLFPQMAMPTVWRTV